jgi:hypothetical protein
MLTMKYQRNLTKRHARSLRVHPVANLVVLKRGSTWASVLKTTSVSGMYTDGENSR